MDSIVRSETRKEGKRVEKEIMKLITRNGGCCCLMESCSQGLSRLGYMHLHNDSLGLRPPAVR
jgi:hypothetical protein